jgi:peptidoglycan/xylan/chitin deacetylase (PgdA/CDA1 family)
MYKAIEEELPALATFTDALTIEDRYAGMSEAQVAELANDPLFDVGAHTVDHPSLTRCAPDEMKRQLEENKSWLERRTGKPCTDVAYPRGDYNSTVVARCVDLRFAAGYGVECPGGTGSVMEMPRIGIYSPSTSVLALKVVLGTLLRSCGVRLG